MLEEQALDPLRHDRKGFDCGVNALDHYLKNLAGQHRRKGVAQTYVLVDSDAATRILGYYTLSAAQVDSTNLPTKLAAKLPRYPVPYFKMGRFAIGSELQDQRLGSTLLALAVERCLEARRSVGA